jgi:hypothetical protein
MRTSKSLRTRGVVGVTVLGLLLAACRVPGEWIPGEGRPHGRAGITVVAPANRSQAPASGEVPIRVTLAPGVDPTRVRVSLIAGWPEPSRPPLDLTGRMTRLGSTLTGTLHAADLAPGLSTVKAETVGRGLGRRVAFASFSWEPAVEVATADRCDVTAAARCLLPFPNDFFTVADRSTPTGRRVQLAAASMPVNSSGVAVDPTEWNRNDGFSPGAMILTLVPGVDLARSGAAPITDIGASLRRDQPIVLLDADTGERWPIWSELDAQADPADRAALVIRPARNLTEGHRYVVALRGLRDGMGAPIAAERGFALYRDRVPTFTPAVERRRGAFERIFGDLRRAGIPRRDLTAAWDFTVASSRSLASRLLHIRDDAFASLDGAAPTFSVTKVTDDVDDQIFRRVEGTFSVPSYLTGDGSPGHGFHYPAGAGPDALPSRNGDFTAGFICNIPRAATADGHDPIHPARGGVYGHGLLGSNTEVNAGNVRTMANAHDFVFCATKWAGFSEDDIGAAISALSDFSTFPQVADRTQQGFLNALFLGRLLKDPRGFASAPAFRAGAGGTPVLDGTVFYDGNSQGGILGGAVTAVSTEWTRAVLGVPGMNYSTLLQRSSDFITYAQILDPAYPDELDRMLAFSIVQMLWDRAEANGYAAHMTDHPYPGTPEHQVLMHVAFGDHQVANVTAEVEARTIGARLLQPALAAGRSPDVTPQWGIPGIPQLPWPGSAVVYWDSGNPAPPLGNLAPSSPAYGDDPHENPRRTPAAQQQKSDFLRPDGRVVDSCGHAPCRTS